ncbi:MAG TPA: tetratricopeptide repeat protein [Thermoplasmata archaeon]|nr:tetratricopeptide repeat protein [Thermoplasmata archaeon]
MKRIAKKGPAAPASAPSSSSGLQRAHELFKQGRATEALAILRPLLQRKGELDGDACALAAACLGAEGDYAEAARVDRLLTDADPENPQGWNSLGYDLFHAGDLEGALEAFEQAVRLEPTRASTYFNLARIAARMGDKSKVIDHFAKAVELQPDLQDRLDEDPDLRPFKDDPDMQGRLPGGTPSEDPYAEYYATRS